MWINGPTNTGKNTIAMMLDDIFQCDLVQEGESHFYQNVNVMETKPQVILMDEDEMKATHFFKEKNIAKMKRLLECRCYGTNHKYGSTKLAYVGYPVAITFNELPFQKLSDADLEAIKSIMKLYGLYIDKLMGTNSFPFTASQIALHQFERYLREKNGGGTTETENMSALDGEEVK